MGVDPEGLKGFEGTGPLVPSDPGSTELDAPNPTLVEIADGMAVWLGDVPPGVELASLDLLPEIDRKALGDLLASVGSTATAGGKMADALASAQGLYRLSGATRSLLEGGAQLAVKDGANLGAVIKNGQVIAQARFIPAGLTAASAVAALGPTVALLGLQLALGEVASLARTNLEYTKQVLEKINRDHWVELTGLEATVANAADAAGRVGAVTQTIWDSVASKEADINKQYGLYQGNVASHLAKLRQAKGKDQHQYLAEHAYAIVFDSHALVRSLRMYAQYCALKAAMARERSHLDPNERMVYEQITRDTPREVEERLREIRELILQLVRVLRISAELPEKPGFSLGGRGKQGRTGRPTAEELLKALEPLADLLQPPAEMPAPETRCVPEALDAEPYLKMLRWHLDGDEQMRAIAFACEGTCGSLQPVVAKNVDATWKELTGGLFGALTGITAPKSTLVAVTDRRIITADPEELRKQGTVRESHPLETVRYVRPRGAGRVEQRPTVGVTTERIHYEWMFPEEADVTSIDALTAALSPAVRGELTMRSAEPTAPSVR